MSQILKLSIAERLFQNSKYWFLLSIYYEPSYLKSNISRTLHFLNFYPLTFKFALRMLDRENVEVYLFQLQRMFYSCFFSKTFELNPISLFERPFIYSLIWNFFLLRKDVNQLETFHYLAPLSAPKSVTKTFSLQKTEPVCSNVCPLIQFYSAQKQCYKIEVRRFPK